MAVAPAARELTQNPLQKTWEPYDNGLPAGHSAQRGGERHRAPGGTGRPRDTHGPGGGRGDAAEPQRFGSVAARGCMGGGRDPPWRVEPRSCWLCAQRKAEKLRWNYCVFWLLLLVF